MKGKVTNKKETDKNNKSAKPKGFSFADAMYGIKDVASEYEAIQIEGSPFEEYKLAEKEQQKKIPKPKPKTMNNKIQVIKKQPIKQISPAIQEKDIFKVNPGKQFGSKLEQIELKSLKVNEHVFQLTGLSAKKPSQWEYNIFCDGISAQEFLPEARVSFDFEATDVKQGGLGNCYLIASLASLSHLPHVLRERIPKFKQYNAKDKIFQVNLFESGKYLEISVQNLFPKIFVKPVGSDISLLLLQKAYAQAYGNYQITNYGHACDSLRDLTGAPTQYIDLKDPEQLIKKLKICFKQKYPVLIASKTSTHKELSAKHSYNVLDFKAGQNILLKLRDPRGCSYQGFPSAIAVNNEESANGIFWIDYTFLLKNFEVITACKVKYGYNYFYKTYKQKQLVNNQAQMLLTFTGTGQTTFTCHQKHKKFYDDKFKYQMIRIMLAKVNITQNKIKIDKTICADFKIQQTVTIEQVLEAGTYILFYQIGSSSTQCKIKTPDQALTVSVYTEISPQNINFSLIKGNQAIEPYIQNYMSQHTYQFKQSVSDQRLYRYFGAFYGYLCMFYDNKSKKSVTEDLTYDTENITIRDKKISLKPQQQKVILHPIGSNNNGSHKFGFKTKTFYK